MEILLDAFLDSVRILPFLFFIYLLVEYLEHENNCMMHKLFAKSQKAGPVLGALFGTIPQCGFSVIASELYSNKIVTLGTLIAIFVATSDEAIPLMLAHPDRIFDMLLLMAVKIIIAIIAGFLTDLVYKSRIEHKPHETGEHKHFHGNCESCEGGIFKSAVIHSVKIFAFLFIINLILGFAAGYIAPFMKYMTGHGILQVMLCSLFGIIPNCAASVVLTELYLSGVISLASLIGGLCTGAGVGLAVLFKQNHNLKQNLLVVLEIYLIGVISGGILQFIL